MIANDAYVGLRRLHESVVQAHDATTSRTQMLTSLSVLMTQLHQLRTFVDLVHDETNKHASASTTVVPAPGCTTIFRYVPPTVAAPSGSLEPVTRKNAMKRVAAQGPSNQPVVIKLDCGDVNDHPSADFDDYDVVQANRTTVIQPKKRARKAE